MIISSSSSSKSTSNLSWRKEIIF